MNIFIFSLVSGALIIEILLNASVHAADQNSNNDSFKYIRKMYLQDGYQYFLEQTLDESVVGLRRVSIKKDSNVEEINLPISANSNKRLPLEWSANKYYRYNESVMQYPIGWAIHEAEVVSTFVSENMETLGLGIGLSKFEVLKGLVLNELEINKNKVAIPFLQDTFISSIPIPINYRLDPRNSFFFDVAFVDGFPYFFGCYSGKLIMSKIGDDSGQSFIASCPFDEPFIAWWDGEIKFATRTKIYTLISNDSELIVKSLNGISLAWVVVEDKQTYYFNERLNSIPLLNGRVSEKQLLMVKKNIVTLAN